MAELLVELVGDTLREPMTTVVLLLAVVLAVPPLFERLRLPGLVGLIGAGIVLGGSGLGWLDAKSETMVLLAEIGKIYLMFVAGLEIDLAIFKQTRDRALTYGVLTFAVPMAGGIAIGLLFQFGWLAAVLIGSLLASHTLLAYPIVQRLGITGDEVVVVAVGATIFTDIGSLIVLAVCLGINQGDFSTLKLVTLLGSLGIYAIAVLVGLSQLSRVFFQRTGKDEGNQFLFVMLAVFLAALVAQLIGVENIIGAFLAGLAVNGVIGNGPVKDKTEFLGSVLFIPIFFVAMGLYLDLSAFGQIMAVVELPVAIIVTLLGTKLLAALGARYCFGYSWVQTWTLWSLSVPQVAATLAAALVGYEAGIINAQTFNSVILLMLVTVVVGPLVTTQAARRLTVQPPAQPEILTWLPPPNPAADGSNFAVVVPLHNPGTEQWLLELAAIAARYERGRIIPLAVAAAQPQMRSAQLSRAIQRGRLRLNAAQTLAETLTVSIEPRLRIENNIAQGICHLSREENANLIILGMNRGSPWGSGWFNTIQDNVLWAAHCPVVVARLQRSPRAFKSIVLPVEHPSRLALQTLRFAQVLGSVNQATVTLLHVHSPRLTTSQRDRLHYQFQRLLKPLPGAETAIAVQLLPSDGVASSLITEAQAYDLVILRLQHRSMGNRFTLKRRSPLLLHQLKQSVILVGEPRSPFSEPPQRNP
ncbi:MAG: cation:proton antiporter [Cyanobacteria bacterium P01_H01_bin.119]